METGKDCAQFSFLASHPFQAHTSFKLMFNTQQPPLLTPPTPSQFMSHIGPSSHPHPSPSACAHHTATAPSQPHPLPLGSRMSHSGFSLSIPLPSQLTFNTQWPLPLNPTPSVLAHVHHTVALPLIPTPHHQLVLITQRPLLLNPTPFLLAHVCHTVASPSQFPFPLSSLSTHSGPSLSTPPPPS